VRRPRVRTADDSTEVVVPSYELFSSTEVLGRMALERMPHGLSTRRYHHGLEPVGEQVEARAASTSRAAVSRRFVAATERALAELMAADLSGLDLLVGVAALNVASQATAAEPQDAQVGTVGVVRT
jgi:putative transposase